MDHYGLADRFPAIQKKANEALICIGVNAHFDEYTNGAVEAVASGTGQTKEKVMESYSKYYYSGKLD